MKTQKPIVLVLLLFTGLTIIAQTSNFGELSIFPGAKMSIAGNFNNVSTATLISDGELYISSNLNNDGLYSYLDPDNDGLVNFEGTRVQRISGERPIEFYNVMINKSRADLTVELIADVSIVNTAEFLMGIVKNDDFGGRIVFEQFAGHRYTSNNSHVDGEVYKKGNTAFDFPIGDGGFYRKAAISSPDTENDLFASEYFLKNSNIEYPHNLKIGNIELIDDAEYWTITREEGFSEVKVTLSWNDDTTPAAITNGFTSAIHVVRWDQQQGFWVDEGGIVDNISQTVTSTTAVSGYGIFTLARVKDEFISPGGIVVYNAISPNDDVQNNFFFIDGITDFPNNSVQIFNRWGTRVYETTGYNETDNVFKGFSENKSTLNGDKLLPAGSYFYVLNYEYDDGIESRMIDKTGYLYITGNDH